MRSSVKGTGKSSGRPTLDPRSRNQFTGAMPLETEQGVWFVGVGPSLGVAAVLNLDVGFYFTSEDGFNWTRQAIPVSIPAPNDGFLGSGYANGMWVGCGVRTELTTGQGLIISTTDPRDVSLWRFERPYGFFGGTVAVTPAAYDNEAGLFTVPVGPIGQVTIRNDAVPADPEDPTWPHQGADYLSSSVLGYGTMGLVEVRVRRKTVFVHAGELLLNGAGVPADAEGGWPTDYLESRKPGAFVWTPVFHETLNGTEPDTAGLALRGLVWGVVKKAVEFAPGDE